MEFKQRIVLVVAGCVVLTVVWFFLFYTPQNTKINEVQEQMKELQREIDFVVGNLGGLDSLRKEVTALEEELEEERKKIISTDMIISASESIRKKGKEFRLQIEKVAPKTEIIFGDKRVQDPIVKLPITLNIIGQFDNFRKFLESFDDFPFLLKSGKLNIETDDSIYPNLLIELTVYIFAYQG